KGGAIPLKYKELTAVAVALTTQCPYCTEVHAKKARKAGATEQELAETTLVAAALQAGGAVTHGTHALEGRTGLTYASPTCGTTWGRTRESGRRGLLIFDVRYPCFLHGAPRAGATGDGVARVDDRDVREVAPSSH